MLTFNSQLSIFNVTHMSTIPIPPPPPIEASQNKHAAKPSNNYWDFPVAFYFKVEFQGDNKIDEIAFKEISGLNVELELETITEGGVNDFEHKVPKRTKHGNLVLKRSLMPINKLNEQILRKWINAIFGGSYAYAITTQNIIIHLLNSEGNTLHSWTCANAYPVKLEIDSFDSEKNQIIIESMEFAYTTVTRSK